MSSKLCTRSRTLAAAALAFLFALNAMPALACTQDEALNKMMALNRAQQKLMSAGGSHGPDMVKAAEMAKEVAGVGQTLADQKYVEACARYDEIATKYGVNIEEASKGMVTMAEIRKDGGKRGGTCSQSDASVKLMRYIEQLSDKAANGEIESSVIGDFSSEMQQHNDLIMTDPSAYCEKLEQVKGKYGL